MVVKYYWIVDRRIVNYKKFSCARQYIRTDGYRALITMPIAYGAQYEWRTSLLLYFWFLMAQHV